jgi:predicted AAA+ superfamily ATPase
VFLLLFLDHEIPSCYDGFSWLSSSMLKRSALQANVQRGLQRHRVVALLGPRQCGKTTLARLFVSPKSLNYFDLEDPVSLARLDEPMNALRDLRGIVVIDEIQRRPDLFPIIRVLTDRKPLPAHFLILGSASPDLLRQSSETLAGRIERIDMGGFSLAEVGVRSQRRHWMRGGFPLSYLARSDGDSFAWRKQFIQTFLERDVPQFGVHIPATTLLRFWTMLAHYHGQIWNAAEVARSLAVSESSARRYVDMLSDLFMIRQLQPWHANLKKRQVKSPKVYLRDTGLLHQLLGIESAKALFSHPKLGASWEGYVIEEVIRALDVDDACFWATHNGAEIDLILSMHGRTYGVECKRVDAPRLTPSMRSALEELGLSRVAVIYPGTARYALASNIIVVPVGEIPGGARSIFGIG